MFRTTRALVAVPLLAASLAAFTPSHAERPARGRSVTTTYAPDLDSVPGLSAARAELAVLETGEYLAALERQAVGDYIVAVQAQEAEALRVAATRNAVTHVTNSGAHSDAWWRGVSVCEQGGRNDGYFGYFSIMDGSAGGLDWSTQVAMANGIISRYGDGAWAASCVAAGYAASPGG